MTSTGRVRFWHAEAGWGVIDSTDTPGGCWAHFSVVSMPGYRTLDAGEIVEFDYEDGGQDGYPFSATQVRRHDQHRALPDQANTGPSAAYRSTLTFSHQAESSTGSGASSAFE
jgi:CspA family cold shock protein